jgi:hypothetical protein
MSLSKKWTRVMQDVRTYREANADSDHFLVAAKMWMRVAKQALGNTRNKWDVEKLNHAKWNDEYKNEIRKKLETREEKVDIDEEWKNLKESIVRPQQKPWTKNNKKKRKEWFDEECEKKRRSNTAKTKKKCGLVTL